MYALSGERILTAWERGRGLREPWRALALLELAVPERRPRELASLTLAERNALLLRLRAATFGRDIEGFAVCAKCQTQLELALDAEDLAQGLRAAPEETWTEGGAAMRMRPANSMDIAASLDAVDEEEAAALLLARTLDVNEAQVNVTERANWVETFERINAAAEIQCVLSCAACGAHAVMDFDVAEFLWREVSLAARRLLADIHRLASAYGWSEEAIVGMSAARRALYLEMVSA